MRKIILLIVFFISVIFLVNNMASAQESAHLGEIEDGKNLVESGVSCDKLSDDELESIGEYYMEQMHPDEQHELMDNMMGGEGSGSLKQMHIQMAKVLYCGESGGTMSSGGMMGMMNMMGGQNIQSGTMQGMIGNFGYWNFINVLYVILLIGLIILVYLLIIKLWKNMKGKGRKK